MFLLCFAPVNGGRQSLIFHSQRVKFLFAHIVCLYDFLCSTVPLYFLEQNHIRRTLAISPCTLFLLTEIRCLYFRVCPSHSRSVFCSFWCLQLQNFLSAACSMFPYSISTAWAAFLLILFHFLIFVKNKICVYHSLWTFMWFFKKKEIYQFCYIEIKNLILVEYVKKKLGIYSYVKYSMCKHTCIIYLLHHLYLELRMRIYSPFFTNC